jgi:phosphoribosylformimino-5-aminoimidazole carboxamide ribonucleotide (ProFAR) isomerase
VIEIIPAVDVASGQVVQNGGDPLEVALGFQGRGASRLHLVDLDRAFSRGDNRDVIERVVGRLEIPVQLSGGIAADAALELALASGADRVVLALSDPEWVAGAVARHGERVAVALDVRGELVEPRGTGCAAGALDELLPSLGARRYVVTDVERDGALSGPNLDLLGRVRAATEAALIASGGIASNDDLAALEGLAEAAIVGTALYSGAIGMTSPSRSATSNDDS